MHSPRPARSASIFMGLRGMGPRIEIRLVCINVISNRHRQDALWDVLSGPAPLYQQRLFACVRQYLSAFHVPDQDAMV